MGIRFLHTADWQIGMKGSSLGEAGSRVAAQRIDTVERIFTTAREHGIGLVLACGDLFERNEVDAETVGRLAAILGRYPDIEVHAIPGNHDLAGPGSVWNRDPLRRLPRLVVHRKPEPARLGGLVVHPFPVTSRYSARDPLAELPDLRGDGLVHVAMAHGHLTTVTFGAHEEDIRLPIDPRHVERAGLDYLALGHWHGTRIERTSDGRARIAYPGTHEQTSYREKDAGHVLLVDIESQGAEPRLTPIRTGVLNWNTASFTFAEDLTLDRFLGTLEGTEANLLELEVSGELPVGLYPEWCVALDSYRGRFLDLRVQAASLRWRHGGGPPPIDVGDASLHKVLERLQEADAAAAGEDPQVLGASLALFGRLVREAAP
jgi:hypothetical protein